MRRRSSTRSFRTRYMGEKGIDSIILERNGWGIALNDARSGKGNCLLRITRRMGFFPACPANADEEIIGLVREGGGLVAKKKYWAKT